MAPITKLNFITGNKNKLAEVRAILGNVVELDNQAVDVPEIQGTIEDIAKEKCRRAAEAVGSLKLDSLYPRSWTMLICLADKRSRIDRGYSAGISRFKGPSRAIYVRPVPLPVRF